MSHEQRYSIGELAAAANTTPRTIRYYTAEGLLTPPDTQGRYAVYRHEHLMQLRAIALLKQAYLPLHAIKARIAGLSAEELEQMLSQSVDAETDTFGVTQYTPQLLGTPQHIAEAAQNYAINASSPPAHYGFAAPPYATTAQHNAPPAPYPFAQPTAPTFTPYAALPQGESWQRIVLAAGVELNIREPLSAEERERIERLLAAAKQIFP